MIRWYRKDLIKITSTEKKVRHFRIVRRDTFDIKCLTRLYSTMTWWKKRAKRREKSKLIGTNWRISLEGAFNKCRMRKSWIWQLLMTWISIIFNWIKFLVIGTTFFNSTHSDSKIIQSYQKLTDNLMTYFVIFFCCMGN